VQPLANRAFRLHYCDRPTPQHNALPSTSSRQQRPPLGPFSISRTPVLHTAMASAMSAARSRSNGISRINMLLVYVFHALVPMVKAIPLPFGGIVSARHKEEPAEEDANLILYFCIAIALVLAGGVFAGLTIA
jgi:hypothetical protein